jgi:hypothetical protein
VSKARILQHQPQPLPALPAAPACGTSHCLKPNFVDGANEKQQKPSQRGSEGADKIKYNSTVRIGNRRVLASTFALAHGPG